MLELIERLEKATGPDRELADEVLLACGWTIDEYGPGPDRARIWQDPDPKGEDYLDGDHPDPTASIDAAMMLAAQLPDDFGVGMFRSSYMLGTPDAGARWAAEVWNIRDRVAKDYQENLAQMKIYSGKHASAPVALCAAILKARAQT